jgi:hypothetical protein
LRFQKGNLVHECLGELPVDYRPHQHKWISLPGRTLRRRHKLVNVIPFGLKMKTPAKPFSHRLFAINVDMIVSWLPDSYTQRAANNHAVLHSES